MIVTVVTIGAVVSILGKSTKKTGEMKTLKVEFSTEKASKKEPKAKSKGAKPMDFTQWVAHYVKMSGGNPV